jgi:HK97 family phage major capsid protein
MNYETELLKSLSELDKNIGNKFHDMDTKTAELADRLLGIEQRGTSINDFRPVALKSAGDAITKAFEANAEIFAKTRNVTLSIETKSITSGLVAPTVANGGITIQPSEAANALISAIPMRPLQGAATMHYARMTDQGVSYAVQNGEGAAKVESQPVFETVQQNAITIAGWCTLSEQALKTQGELASVMDIHMRNQLITGIDKTLIAGTAVAAWPFSGLNTLSFAYTSATYTLIHDAIVEATAHQRWGGYQPDVVCMNPMTYLEIALKKDTTGQYLSGAYMGEFPAMLHGMRVTFSAEIPLGKALVVDSRYVEVLLADQMNVQLAYTMDNFTKNLITARAEVAIIPVVRDLGSIILVAPKP